MLEGGVRSQFLLRVATSRRPCCSQEQPNSSPEQDDATLYTWDTRSFNKALEMSCFKPEANSSTGKTCSWTATTLTSNVSYGIKEEMRRTLPSVG